MKIAVLGGGLTGLTAAWRVATAGHSVRLLEAGPRLGGPVRTESIDGWTVECAPNSFRGTSPETRSMLAELGLDDERIEPDAAASNRYVALGSRLVAIPPASSPKELMASPLLGMGAKMRIASETSFKPRIRKEDASVADFAREHFGDQALERIGQPLVSGIWAGDAERLSLRHAFPQAWEAERTTGSVLRALAEAGKRRKEQGLPAAQEMVSFRRGMQALPDALAGRLPAGTVELNADVRSLSPGAKERWCVTWAGPGGGGKEEFEWVLAALPGYGLSRLEIGTDTGRPLSGLGEIEYPPVASVFVGYRRDQVEHPLDGFGALVPTVDKRTILGVIFTSSLFPGRAPAGHVALTVLAGGALNPGIAGLSPGKLAENVCADLGALLGARGKPAFLHHNLWPRGIPQYNLGFERHVATMAECEETHPGLLIGGSVRDGISIPECMASGAAMAKRALS
jgi:protoporphyrinogen/coproporphyrinogen III oxidase